MPQSTRTLRSPQSSRVELPVTTPQAPWKVTVAMAVDLSTGARRPRGTNPATFTSCHSCQGIGRPLFPCLFRRPDMADMKSEIEDGVETARDAVADGVETARKRFQKL